MDRYSLLLVSSVWTEHGSVTLDGTLSPITESHWTQTKMKSTSFWDCNTVYFWDSPTFPRNISPPTSRQKSKSSKKAAEPAKWAWPLLLLFSCFAYSFSVQMKVISSSVTWGCPLTAVLQPSLRYSSYALPWEHQIQRTKIIKALILT
jgi:hypothetical protein